MSDPHVKALIYKVEHGKGIDYANTKRLDHDAGGFKVHVENGEARFEMVDHYATEDEARAAVEPFIKAWELAATLDRGVDEFALRFRSAEIIDRDAPSGTIQPEVAHMVMVGMDAEVEIRRASYPSPGSGLRVTPEVEGMWRRYTMYRKGRETLASMSYFCFTVLKASYGGSDEVEAAKKLRVSRKVLKTLRKLSSTAGGKEGRKHDGRASEFTEPQRQWLSTAVNELIRRAAEVDHDPAPSYRQITMRTLPSLNQNSG